jgi:hypothetical protein
MVNKDLPRAQDPKDDAVTVSDHHSFCIQWFDGQLLVSDEGKYGLECAHGRPLKSSGLGPTFGGNHWHECPVLTTNYTLTIRFKLTDPVLFLFRRVRGVFADGIRLAVAVGVRGGGAADLEPQDRRGHQADVPDPAGADHDDDDEDDEEEEKEEERRKRDSLVAINIIPGVMLLFPNALVVQTNALHPSWKPNPSTPPSLRASRPDAAAR